MTSGATGFGAIDVQSGDLPPARFGHSATYVGNMTVVLFGGAVGDSGRYQITNDTYTLDMAAFRWTHITADNPPSARAAHASACVDVLQFVVYGGATGGGSLSTDELYLLDLRKSPQMAWMTVPITGVTPGRRYGHSMCYSKPNLIVFGGNDGTRSINDVWAMDVEKSPFTWTAVQLTPGAKQPPPRVYHSAEICQSGPAQGMMVVFGGRTTNSQSLRDTWGLRQHRDGRWDWVEAPLKKEYLPEARFQHSCVFIGPKLVVVGGRDGEVSKPLSTAVYDTEACEWRSLPTIGRFRHAAWALESVVYTFGGFDHQTQTHPTTDLQALDTALHPDTENRQRAAAATKQQVHTSGPSSPPRRQPAATQPMESVSPIPQYTPQVTIQTPQRTPDVEAQSRGISPDFAFRPTPTSGKQVRLAAHVQAKIDSPHNPDFSALVRKISLDRLEEEGKKIRGFAMSNHLPSTTDAEEHFADNIIRRLLRPNITPNRMEREFNSQTPFCVSWEEISTLCRQAVHYFRQELMVLQLRAPIKVYGDIHGQFYDLMRLFGNYKTPVTEDWADVNALPTEVAVHGDLDSIEYLFLGDYVDRGTNSLEVVILLLALKCRYPKSIYMIRGNHEDPAINSIYGFKDECKRRLREDPDNPESCWNKINRVFEYIPLGALIEDNIICIHGGIGGSIHTVRAIAELKRPLRVAQVPTNEIEQRITDLLWSDPTDNDSIKGVTPNEIRDPDGSGHIKKYGPDRVTQFLKDNNLDLIIRAHECVMDGFERFAGGRLITLFSATDYCGSHKNAGALLFIRRDLTVIPKIIYPPEREQVHTLRSTWLPLDSRPPTPPRAIRRMRDQDLGF